MKTLSAADVQQYRSSFNLMPGDQLQKMGMELFNKQPEAYQYLYARTQLQALNQDEQELLLYLGIITWGMVSRSRPRLPSPRKVPLNNFEESEMLNLMLLTGYEKASAEEVKARYQELAKDHMQPAIVRFFIDAIWDDPSGADIQAANKGLLIRYLLSLLDGLLEM
jgi:hypothetical protein